VSDGPLVRRPRALLSLLRLSLAPTLVADLCAGVACAGGGLADVARLLPVSLLLFVGGMALNARVDVEEDRRTRPRRALPSGDVAPVVATLLAVAGLVAAPLVAAAVAGGFRRDTVAFAAAMALAIAAYHTPLKRSAWLGPLLLGAIRGADLLLGAVALAGAAGAWRAAGFAALCYAAYVAGASFIAHQEDRDARIGAVRTGALLAGIAIVAHAVRALAASGAAPPDRANVVRAAALVAVWHLWNLRGARLLFRSGGFGLIPIEAFARLFLSRLPLLPAAAALAAGNAPLAFASIVAFFAVFALVRFIPPT